MGNIFAIGDIHGCLKKLIALIEKIGINKNEDKLIFLGDYIDRGNDSFEVVEFLIRLKNHFKNIIFLKGNHEEMLEKFLLKINREHFLLNGGSQTIASYSKHQIKFKGPLIPSTHIDFFKSLSLFFQTDKYIFVHAGLRDDIPIEQQDPDDLLWIREKFFNSKFDFGKTIIFGHTYFRNPFFQHNRIGIDTGAVYGNRLTCIRLPSLDFIQV